jgi:ABC-2 type transport system ATP-binding protein
MNDDAIVVEGLQKSYGSVRALCGVDFTARTGSVLGLLGPNGAGKTTAVRILTTLLQPDAGGARVAGLDVVRDAAALRAKIGLAGQYAAVDENLTGFENLEMVGQLYHMPRKEARARADELLERFELTEAARRPAKTYSGGMRRRLDLAASLLTRPPLIFLDEPTTGLDPRTRGQMWDTIRDLVRSGCTVLLTTQYLDEADQLADRIAVIDRGRKVAEGTADELKSSVGQSALQLQLADPADLPVVADEARRLVGEEAVLTPEARRANVPLTRTDQAVDVLVALRDRGVVIESVTVQKPSLDEVFLALTGHDTHDGTPASGADDHDLQMEDAR